MRMSSSSSQNILLGGGAHAHALLRLSRDCGLHFRGYISPRQQNEYWKNVNCSWLGTDNVLAGLNTQKIKLYNGVGSTSSTLLRQKLFVNASQNGFKFGTFIHPSAFLAQDAKLSDGIQVFPGVRVLPGVKISENVLLNTGCIIEHDCEISPHAHIAPGVVLCGGVNIGRGVHVGASSVVMQGVTIGSNATIGMGSVVLFDVPKNAIAVGNPAKILVKKGNN